MKLFFLLFILSILLSHCDISKYVKYGATSAKFEVINDTAIVNGLLGKKTYYRLEKLIEKNPTISTLTLKDVPGSIDDEYNIQTCFFVNQNNLNTYLSSNSRVASGGVDFFLSGNRRNIEKGAKVGVHSWSDGIIDGACIPKEDKSHNMFLNLYKSIGIDTSFYWFTLRSASADSIHWMSYDEMNRFGLIKN